MGFVAQFWIPSIVGGLKELAVVAWPMPPATLTDALRETLTLFDPSGPPMTTNEVAERLDLGRRSTYDRLQRLADRGDIETKKVGANARVWWRQSPATTTGPGGPDRSVDADGEQFALLVEAVEEYAIFMLDPDGRIRTWNRGAERIKGYERERVLGEHLSTFYTEADREAGTPEENLADAETGGVTTDEGWRVRSDGSTFWAHVTLTAIYDDADELRGYAKVTRDMTDRREREEAVRRERDLLEKVLETSPIGMGVFRPDGSVDRMNERMTEFLGLSDDGADSYTLGDQELLDDSGDTLAAAERPAGRVVETGEPVTDQEVRIDDEDQGTRWFSVNAAPLVEETAESDRVVATMTDVTQQKVQLQRLERQRDDLEVELEAVFDRVDDAFYALDDEYRFTFVNERAEALLGATEAELLGESVWEAYEAAKETRVWDAFHEAMETQEPTSYEVHREPLGFWVEANVYPSETGLSVYFRDVTERKERERELERYESIVETVDDGIYVVDEDGRFTMANDAYAELTGYPREELLGMHVSTLVDEETVAKAREMERELLAGEREAVKFEAEVETATGGSTRAEATFSIIEDDGSDYERVGVVRDVTERVEREETLRTQRERLAALDALNDVVRNLSGAVIDQSTREEIERVVCEGLAASGSYEFAWIGDVDAGTQTVRSRTEAGVDGYLDDVTISVDPDDPRSAGPTGLAVQTHRMQTVEDVLDDETYEQWRDQAREYGFRSSAAVPIVHEGVLYGVINVYADRPNAFTGDERDVIEHLGEIVGHAIASVERKRALTSDEVVELSFRIPGVFDAFDLPTADGRLTLEQAVPVGDGDYLEYGSATGDMLDVLDAAVESIPHWAAVRTIRAPADDVPARFELRLEEPPVLSVVTALGGYVDAATIEDGDYQMRIHLAPSADVRRLIDNVREADTMAQLVSRQQVSRASASPIQLLGRITDQLTDRQLAVLEAAYFAGYFEWPREADGEEVAESFGISAPTFHQHLRSALRKVFQVVLEDPAAV